MARIIFMGTPQFSVPTLEALAAQHQVLAVFTQPDRAVGRGLELKASPVKIKALELGIPVHQPEKLSQPGQLEILQGLNPDFIVVVAYGQILKKNVLSLPKFACINIHSSLLPRWRGAAPIQWAILAGDAESGVTTMHMAEKLDAGDVLLQARTPISREDTAGTLHDRLAGLGAQLILPTLEGCESGKLQAQKQDESRVTYAAKLSKDMETLDPKESAETLGARVRALNPWPGTSVRIESNRLKIRKALPRKDISGEIGEIFQRAGMVLLGTSVGSLELMRVQWEGKKEMDISEFLNGYQAKLPMKVSSNLIKDRSS